MPFQSQSLSLSLSPGSGDQLFLFIHMALSFPECHKHEIVQRIIFCTGIFTLHNLAETHFIVYPYIITYILFIYLPGEGHWVIFWSLIITRKTAINIFLKIFECRFLLHWSD